MNDNFKRYLKQLAAMVLTMLSFLESSAQQGPWTLEFNFNTDNYRRFIGHVDRSPVDIAMFEASYFISSATGEISGTLYGSNEEPIGISFTADTRCDNTNYSHGVIKFYGKLCAKADYNCPGPGIRLSVDCTVSSGMYGYLWEVTDNIQSMSAIREFYTSGDGTLDVTAADLSGLNVNGNLYARVKDLACPGAASEWSQPLQFYSPPTTFEVTGGGKYCIGGPGLPINLAGSQVGINYQLKVEGVNSGTVMAGTGAGLVWSNRTTVGRYTVVAAHVITGCTQMMSQPPGSTTVFIAAAPSLSDLEVKSNISFCENTPGKIYMPITQSGVAYQLKRNDGRAEGAVLSGTGGEIAWTNIVVPPGTWTYSVTASNIEACNPIVVMSSTVTITKLPARVFDVSGGGIYCGEAPLQVDISGSENAVAYNLYRNSALVQTIMGTGGPLSFANLTSPGIYTVRAGDNAQGCLWEMRKSATISDGTSLTITGSAGMTFCSGQTVVLQAPDIAGQTYRWQRDGVNIPGATESYYNVVQSGTYQVINGCGKTSNTITLTALPSPPFELFHNGENEFCEGGSILLEGTQNESYTYQWKHNGQKTPGEINHSYVVSESGLYNVVITAPNQCSTESEEFQVTVNPMPRAYVAFSGDASFCAGGSIALHTSDQEGYTYQWTKDGAAIPGAISSLYNATEAGRYAVQVSTSKCAATAEDLEVTVKTLPAPISGITGEVVAEEGKAASYTVEGADDATRFVWSIPVDASLTPADGAQRAVSIRFHAEGEEIIKAYAEKDGCLSEAFEKEIRVRPQLITPTGIPEEVKISREGNQPLPAVERQFLWKDLDIGNDNDVFQAPPCLDGEYYAGFQLYYDLGDQKTVQDWSATLTLAFMRGDDTIWEEPLTVDMTSQTFIATIFHDKLISCADDYHVIIRNKISTGPVPEENIYLKFLLYKRATDVFNASASLPVNCAYDQTQGQTVLTWDYAGKASLSFDIEWVFIDNFESFKGTSPQEAFLFKAPVGVNLAGRLYKHLTYYPAGRIWYRIRAVGYNPQYPGHRIVGQWFYPASAITIANHEQQKTWQQQTVFAEEGKYKKVIHYFDGTLRQRQSQTNLSTENVTLVAESLYDFEGRKTGDVLSVPAMDAALTYKPAFNRFVASDPLVTSATSTTKKKFHYDNRKLENSILANTSGAGKYYSSANTNQTIHKDYIPDGEGYLYSQSEFLNDGTGRVSKQSGVGKAFKMDGNVNDTHILRNFYGEATAAELVRLFGSNAGNASHYKKTLTVDANGQASVSYQDQEGSVIATALAGEAPKNVSALKSLTDLPTGLITEDISDKNKITPGKSETIHKLLNVYPTEYTFSYDLAAFASQTGSFGCQSCVFDLRITISGPDAKPVDLGAIAGNESTTPLVYERKNLTAPASNCDNAVQLNAVSFKVMLSAIGDYTITKTLIAHDRTFEEMRTLVMQDAAVQQQVQAIRDGYVLDDTDCAICTTCPVDNLINEAVNEIASQDCDNILNTIREDLIKKHLEANANDYEYEPTPAQIEGHTGYCEYALCVKDKESDVFEKQMARVETWSAAVSGGYDNSVNIDPFFNHPSLSGYAYKSVMKSKLDNIVITDNASFKGKILDVTDPTKPDYKIDVNGNHDVNGYHILYYGLMQKRGEMSDDAYAKELNEQRWILYKSFYLEAKRKVKLAIQSYQACDSTRKQLQRNDQLPTSEADITAWGERNGVPGEVSNEELEMTLYNLTATCHIKLTKPDSTDIANNLRTYFNGNKRNFFRLILKADLGVNPNLVAIQNILTARYNGCSLTNDIISSANPLVCKECIGSSIANIIVNPNFSSSTCGSSGPITETCYYGWKPFNGSPYLQPGKIIDLQETGCKDEGIIASFAHPLVPGKKYQLRFKYKGENAKADVFLSRSTEGIWIGYNIAAPSNPPGYQNSPPPNNPGYGCGYVYYPKYMDAVMFDNGEQTTRVWRKDITSMQEYSDVIIDFVPKDPSTYLILTHHIPTVNAITRMFFKDIQLMEVQACNDNSVCIVYDEKNPALAPFQLNIDWVKASVDSCKKWASNEREHLIEYTTEKLYENTVTDFYNSYRTNCLSKASEKLAYKYVPKEYHYTLYYYDQAKNLVQTVPPEGVKPLTPAEVSAFLAGNHSIKPAHTLLTRYKYRSLNNVMWQRTPDAGESQFWYNNKGQLRLSQNAQQFLDKKYSYTKYDAQGRIAEVGELTTTEPGNVLTARLETASFPEANLYMLADITRTHYDKPHDEIQSYFVQRYLRSRVSWVEVLDKDAADITVTYYSYDIHGNVKSLLQRLPGLGLKRTDYNYDLISGKVNYVFYQYGQPDQFIHKYTYDADNRITGVYTSVDGFIWDREARYQYYLHGPLARTELGEYRVQAQDYFYTLQGWIKGVNMPFAADPGQDGINGSKAGKDVYAYALGYYNGDYKPLNNAVVLSDTRDLLWTRLQESFPAAQPNDPAYTGLYNGNIAWMVTDLAKIGEISNNRTKGMQAMLYRYDQLNRIVRSRSLATYSAGGTIPQGFTQRNATPSPYDEDYSYDGNGNLLTLKRMNEQGALLDDFNYQYYSQTNKLKTVELISEDKVYSSGTVVSNEKLYRNITVNGNAIIQSGANVVLRATDNVTVSPEIIAGDAEFNALITEDPGNYRYDAIGNLIADVKSETTISWTPYSKIREVQVGDTTVISFRYDAAENRIEKKVQRPHGTTVTRYVRDASGNVMSVYVNAILTEQPIYGSSRLGQYTGGRREGYRVLGEKKYELSNHLGNVLTVITDNVGMDHGNVWATVESANDYYPFGMLMVGRSYSFGKYRYGFNGQEKIDELQKEDTHYEFKYREYDSRIGRFWSQDPMFKSFPWNSTYAFAENRPIDGIDLEGREWDNATNNQGKTDISVNVKFSTDAELSDNQINSYKNAISNRLNNTLKSSSDGKVTGLVTFNGGNGNGRLVPSIFIANGGKGNIIAGETSFGDIGINLYNYDGSIKTPETLAIDAVHELLHTVRIEHPFDRTQGADTKLVHKGGPNFTTTSKTDPNIYYNIMNYPSMNINDQNLGKLWISKAPTLITKDQLKLMIHEISLQKQGYGVMPKYDKNLSQQENDKMGMERFHDYFNPFKAPGQAIKKVSIWGI